MHCQHVIQPTVHISSNGEFEAQPATTPMAGAVAPRPVERNQQWRCHASAGRQEAGQADSTESQSRGQTASKSGSLCSCGSLCASTRHLNCRRACRRPFWSGRSPSRRPCRGGICFLCFDCGGLFYESNWSGEGRGWSYTSVWKQFRIPISIVFSLTRFT